MKRFYSNNIQGHTVFLHDEEAQHCMKVLRARVQDKVEVLNGNGVLYEGVVSNLQKKEVQIDITKVLKEQKENLNRLSIAICPTKNPARLEWFLEKATEIGISNIFPVVSERTEKTGIKQERLQHIIVSAAKQSGQLFFPVLHTIQPLKELLQTSHLPFDTYFIAHCEGERQHFKHLYQKDTTALLLIGPEGDFSSKEVSMAVNKNYKPVSLGNSILRVETAGVVACSMVQLLNNE